MWPSRSTSVILTPDTRISRQIWLLGYSYLSIQPSASFQDGPEAGGQAVCRAEGLREWGAAAAQFAAQLVRLLVPAELRQALLLSVQRPKPDCKECHQPPLGQETGHPTRVSGCGECGPTGNRGIGPTDVPAARGPQGAQRTAAFTEQSPAIWRSRQLEFKLDVLCVHED